MKAPIKLTPNPNWNIPNSTFWLIRIKAPIILVTLRIKLAILNIASMNGIHQIIMYPHIINSSKLISKAIIANTILPQSGNPKISKIIIKTFNLPVISLGVFGFTSAKIVLAIVSGLPIFWMASFSDKPSYFKSSIISS